MNQPTISESNREKALLRWRTEQKQIEDHLKLIEGTRKYNLLKSRLMGFLAGDGCVWQKTERKRKNAMHHEVNFSPDHESMVKPYIGAFRYLYFKTPTVFRKENYYVVRASSKAACLDLLKSGVFGIHRWKVPVHFFDSTESKIEWLRAFFDCEANVGENGIILQSVNRKGLEEVQECLTDLNIKSKIYSHTRKQATWSTNHLLCIQRREERALFLKRVGFNHKEKLAKLRMSLS